MTVWSSRARGNVGSMVHFYEILEISLVFLQLSQEHLFRQSGLHGQDRNRGTFLCVWRLASELDPSSFSPKFPPKKSRWFNGAPLIWQHVKFPSKVRAPGTPLWLSRFSPHALLEVGNAPLLGSGTSAQVVRAKGREPEH